MNKNQKLDFEQFQPITISNNRFPRQRFRTREHKPETTLRGGGNSEQMSER